MLPKGLVLLISISLAVGIIALSKQKVLVQELYALETLAHVDTLCLDKTETLTEGNMRQIIMQRFKHYKVIFRPMTICSPFIVYHFLPKENGALCNFENLR